MPRNLGLTTALLLTVLLYTASGAGAPKFSTYPVRQIFKGEPAEPQFEPGEDRYSNGDGHFRGGVTLDAERGPNFAGHYTLAFWTCGSGCSSAIVVDSLTGKLYRNMPFENLVIQRLDLGLESYSFRLNSRLLIVQGFFDTDTPDRKPDCSRRYYLWTGTSFKLLRKVLLKCAPSP